MPLGLIKAIALRSSIIVSAFGIFLISSYMFGPEGRGTIAFLNSFYLPLALFCSMGLGRVVYQETSLSPAIAKVTFRALIILIYILFGIAVLFLLASLFIEHLAPSDSKHENIKYFLLFCGAFPYFLWQNNGNYLYAAINKSHIHDLIILATRTTQVGILVVCVLAKISLEFFLFAYGLTGLLIFIVESTVALRILDAANLPHPPFIQTIKTLISKAKWPYLDSIALAIAPAIFFIIGTQISSADLGHYNFAVQLLGALVFPFTVIQIKIQERLVKIQGVEALNFVKKSFISAILMSLAIMTAATLIPVLLPRVGLSNFVESGPILMGSLLTIPLIGIIFVFQGIWVSTHNAKLSSIINLSMGAVNFITSIILIDRFGLWAGVIGSFASYSVATILNAIALRKLAHNLFKIPKLATK